MVTLPLTSSCNEQRAVILILWAKALTRPALQSGLGPKKAPQCLSYFWGDKEILGGQKFASDLGIPKCIQSYVIIKRCLCVFKIIFPTKHIFRSFPILKTNGMAPFCNLFIERPSYMSCFIFFLFCITVSYILPTLLQNFASVNCFSSFWKQVEFNWLIVLN